VGGVLGVVIGGLLCAGILAIVVKFYPDMQATINQSIIAGFLVRGFPLLY